MSLVSERRGRERLIALVSATIALAGIALLIMAGQARAAETIYWDNYSGDPDSVGFANIDGAGGGQLNIGAQTIESPEGMAYDTVTNRLFVANETGPDGQILAINLDGSGAAPFTAPGAPIDEPEGVTVDPVTRIVYWLNTGGTGSVAWAKLDGSAGGPLNTTGATLDSPCCRLAIDPASGRVFWVNSGSNTIAFANVNNSGGGNLNLAGSTISPSGDGLAVDSAGGRLYFLGTTNEIGFANLSNSGGGNVPTVGGVFNGPWGLAFDPALARFYWGNESNGKGQQANAIGFLNLAGGGGGISIASAPVAGPQDPTILKSPSGAGAPTLARSTKNRSELTCSQGSWAADYPGGFVYQAPRTLAYQWSLNGAPLAGATASTLLASKPGSYTCTVTAANQTGSASQVSAPIKVKAAKVKLTTKKKAKVKAGGVATFKVKGVNQGDLKSKNARVCVKVPKKAKGDLKAKPKCKALGKVKGGGKDSAKLRIKVGESASGAYKVTFQVKGSPGKAAKAKIIVG